MLSKFIPTVLTVLIILHILSPLFTLLTVGYRSYGVFWEDIYSNGELAFLATIVFKLYRKMNKNNKNNF